MTLAVTTLLAVLCGGCPCAAFGEVETPTTCSAPVSLEENRAGTAEVRRSGACPANCKWERGDFQPEGPYVGAGPFKTVLLDTYTGTCEADACTASADWPAGHDAKDHEARGESLCVQECADRGLSFETLERLKKDGFTATSNGDCDGTSCCPDACSQLYVRHMNWGCWCKPTL